MWHFPSIVCVYIFSTELMRSRLGKAIFGFACRITMTLISPHHFSEKLLLLVGIAQGRIAIADISKVFCELDHDILEVFIPHANLPDLSQRVTIAIKPIKSGHSIQTKFPLSANGM